jgi:hypothetical protein
MGILRVSLPARCLREITSRGKRKPANTEDVADDVTGSVCLPLRSTNATAPLEVLYADPLAIWRGWPDDVRGQSIDCGHHIAEEAPAELAACLALFRRVSPR